TVGVLALACIMAGPRPAFAQRPTPAPVQVAAGQETWQDTGIELGDGETATLAAAGQAGWEPGIAQGPDGGGASNCPLAVPEAPVGAVLARVGSAAPVVIGSAGSVAGPGRLFVLYNDCPGQYFDNTGGFEVQLTLAPAAAPASAPTAQVAPVVATQPAPPKQS